MPLTYDDLRARIGDKMGYGYLKSNWSGVAVKVERVERVLEAALSRFYDPAIGGKRHQWSFTTPTITLQLIANQWAYALPSNFVTFMGPLTFAPGSNEWHEPIPLMGAHEVQKRLGECDSTGRPCVAGQRVINTGGIHATSWELIVHPIPDTTYTVKGIAKINPTIPGAIAEVPLGGQPHDLTLIEACLAECDLFDETGQQEHAQRFMECLASSISHDQQVNSAHTLGANTDKSLYDNWRDGIDCLGIPAVTYLGETW